jgi:hypothetical protein
MKKINEKLSEVLDIEPIPTETKTKQIVEVNPVVSNAETDVQADTEFARQNIMQLIEKGNDAIDHLLKVAIESEHPRAYEVASGLIKNLSDLNKDLLELQKRKKDLLPKAADSNNLSIDKAVFIGSTTDLIKMLKQSKKEQQ